MKMFIYSIRDDKADEYGPIFEAKNDEVAKRNFKHMLTSQPIDPIEFAMYRVGYFDHESAEGSMDIDEDSLVCIGSEFFKEENA